MRDPASNCRIEGGEALIELKLRALGQLFNTMDPSPFLDRDLDADAESYIVETMREISHRYRTRLVIHLPETEIASVDAEQLRRAIHRYFGYRMRATRRDLRHVLRTGRMSLTIGLAFLVLCVAAQQGLAAWSPLQWWTRPVSEGLIICGWVAMWRPIQIFLYDWWPIARMIDVYRRLTRTPLETRPIPLPS